MLWLWNLTRACMLSVQYGRISEANFCFCSTHIIWFRYVTGVKSRTDTYNTYHRQWVIHHHHTSLFSIFTPLSMINSRVTIKQIKYTDRVILDNGNKWFGDLLMKATATRQQDIPYLFFLFIFGLPCATSLLAVLSLSLEIWKLWWEQRILKMEW